MPRWRVHALVALVVLLGGAPSLAARQRDSTPALELERQGRYAEAARRFREVLQGDPTDATALFGLERVLQRIGRLEEMVPLLDSALARPHPQTAIRALELRVLGALARTEALAEAAERWIASAPLVEDPYREWAFALAQRGDMAGARAVLNRGTAALGGGALMQELAQLDIVSSDWPAAARHWHAAATERETMVPGAGMSLAQAPPAEREAILRVLQGELRDSTAQWIAVDLLQAWGRPEEAWSALDAALPGDPDRAAALLRRFTDRARRDHTRAAALARGFAFERLAELVTGGPAQQARIDAARAFADAGNRAAAERMLERIAQDTARAPASARGAMATLIAVTADAGRVAEAERRLREWSDRLSLEDRVDLQVRVAWGWVRAGQLDRADGVLGQDTSLSFAALRGWIALYRGKVHEAADWFREAGPYTGTREDATERTEMLALAQRVEPDSVPALGVGLLAVRRGDSATAMTRLLEAAERLPATGGRGDVLALAGRLAVVLGDGRAAELFERAIAADSAGPVTPAAHLALAELAIRDGQPDAAIRRLEHVILAYPESAVVPQARRLLDQVRGAIPRS